MKIINGGRDEAERQIVDELFKPEPVSDAMNKKIKSLDPKGQLSDVSHVDFEMPGIKPDCL